MARNSKSKSRKKLFFVKEEEGIFIVHDEFFNDIESRDEALVIAMRTLGEIYSTMKREAEIKDSLFIGNMKVTTGLQRGLDELDKRWPCLLMQLRSMPRRINGHVFSIC
jgi:hypothetical protein